MYKEFKLIQTIIILFYGTPLYSRAAGRTWFIIGGPQIKTLVFSKSLPSTLDTYCASNYWFVVWYASPSEDKPFPRITNLNKSEFKNLQACANKLKNSLSKNSSFDAMAQCTSTLKDGWFKD